MFRPGERLVWRPNRVDRYEVEYISPTRGLGWEYCRVLIIGPRHKGTQVDVNERDLIKLADRFRPDIEPIKERVVTVSRKNKQMITEVWK